MKMVQDLVLRQGIRCFGEQIPLEKGERNHRFLEEALELYQANGCTAEDAHKLVDYTFNRPVGERHQEIGGTILTLLALCNAYGEDLKTCMWDEILRFEAKIDLIREKQKNKPKYGPLP